MYVSGVENLSKIVTNNLLSNKSLNIQYRCLLGTLIPTTKCVRITFLDILKPLGFLQTCQNKLILAPIYIFVIT